MPVNAGNGLGTHTLDDIKCRDDDAPVAQGVEHAASQHDSFASLQGRFGHDMHRLAVVRQAEGFHAIKKAKVIPSPFTPLPRPAGTVIWLELIDQVQLFGAYLASRVYEQAQVTAPFVNVGVNVTVFV